MMRTTRKSDLKSISSFIFLRFREYDEIENFYLYSRSKKELKQSLNWTNLLVSKSFFSICPVDVINVDRSHGESADRFRLRQNSSVRFIVFFSLLVLENFQRLFHRLNASNSSPVRGFDRRTNSFATKMRGWRFPPYNCPTGSYWFSEDCTPFGFVCVALQSTGWFTLVYLRASLHSGTSSARGLVSHGTGNSRNNRPKFADPIGIF